MLFQQYRILLNVKISDLCGITKEKPTLGGGAQIDGALRFNRPDVLRRRLLDKNSQEIRRRFVGEAGACEIVPGAGRFSEALSRTRTQSLESGGVKLIVPEVG